MALLTANPKVMRSNREILGDSLQLYFSDTYITRAHVRGNASATSEADTLNPGRWVNKLSGRIMDFYFDDRELQKVVIKDQATSEYHIIEGLQYKGLNQASGDRIVVFLANGEAERVEVTGHPELAAGKYMPSR